jgi:hypothetical protein
MTPTKKVNRFNINSLVIEVEEVIKTGLNKILVDYVDRYELLENTHKQIMRLPSIRQELNKHPYDLHSDDDNDHDEPICYKNKNNNKNNNNFDMSTVESLEYRLEKLENKYDTMIPILDKILNKIISLDQEIQSLKSSENISPIKSSTCKPVEKENIKIHFEESSEELVEEEIEEIEESDEEDVNSALITCSTVTLNKESVKVEEKVEEPTSSELKDKIPSTLYHIVPAEELFPNEDLETDVEEESEEDKEADVEDNVDVDDASEAKTDNKLAGDVEAKSDSTFDAVVEGDVEEEASIETETKSETEEDEEDEEEEDLEEELVKEAEVVRELVQEKSPSEEEDDGELFEIEIDDKTYCTNDDQNGFIWELTEDGEQGEKIGYLKDGDAYFYEDEN